MGLHEAFRLIPPSERMVFDSSGVLWFSCRSEHSRYCCPLRLPFSWPRQRVLMTVECVGNYNKASVLPRSSHSLDTVALLYQGLSLLFSFKPWLILLCYDMMCILFADSFFFFKCLGCAKFKYIECRICFFFFLFIICSHDKFCLWKKYIVSNLKYIVPFFFDNSSVNTSLLLAYM